MKPLPAVLALLTVVLLAGCGSSRQDSTPPPDPRAEAERREREMNDTGPSFEQLLAARPGRDDIDRAISMLQENDHYDYRAVSFLSNELAADTADDRIRNALIDVVAHADFPARNLAAESLGRHGVVGARNVLLQKMKEPNFNGPLVEALGRLGNETTVRELDYIIANEQNRTVQGNARAAKEMIEARLKAQ